MFQTLEEDLVVYRRLGSEGIRQFHVLNGTDL